MQTGFIICPMLYAIAMGQIIIIFIVNVKVNVVYALKQKFSEEGVGLCSRLTDYGAMPHMALLLIQS